jgi:hypothetical protein
MISKNAASEICEEWQRSCRNFIKSLFIAGLLPGRQNTLSRIDSTLPFGPSNVKFEKADHGLSIIRYRRMIEYDGQLFCIRDLVQAHAVVGRNTFVSRMDRGGWNIERALMTPAIGEKLKLYERDNIQFNVVREY